MYIAFKWLIGLTLAMWITMCGFDSAYRRSVRVQQDDVYPQKIEELEITRNTTVPVKRKIEIQRGRLKHVGDKLKGYAALHGFMFIAGALVVSLYNRKHEILLYTKSKISKINTNAILEILHLSSEIITIQMNYVILLCCKILSNDARTTLVKIRQKVCSLLTRNQVKKPRINLMLLKKLQEIGEERKNLGQLLIAAIHENKNIRMQYQLESMAKNRLARHVENTQKLIKENRSRYVSFQQLYLVTHQENTYLRSRLNKLVKEKDEAEKNLLELMNEVYKSKNNELKTFCSRFIVRTDDNLLNRDVGAEIQKFLNKSQMSGRAKSSHWLSDGAEAKLEASNSWTKCANARFAEIIQDDVLVPLVSDAPKLKGLPGECVLTVKDKHGLIEKLYEYDYGSDLDNGETIRRIRQYSVYHDKDCFLDCSSLRSAGNECRTPPPGQRISVEYPLTRKRFLTGSDAFQKFMQNNRNVVSLTSVPEPPLLMG
ncbi:unnamed protein product [Chrysodeixis includens]|uniref:Uncharacterized protein n=1 Tax=Chrysodeixis includens TaxID=689277 RepID=A0A9P0BZZ3_CHRIL|nr:unnamed protein product [Chrysodeixis includens]